MAKDEMNIDSCNDLDRGGIEDSNKVQVTSLLTLERSLMEENADHDSSLTQKSREEELESAKAKMGKFREENERLKLLLSKIMKDYQSLHLHFLDILQQGEEGAKKRPPSTDTAPYTNTHQENDDSELDISLTLGIDSNNPKNKEIKKISSLISHLNSENTDREKERSKREKLALGLSFGVDEVAAESKTEAARSESSFGDSKEDNKELTERSWPPSKVLKTMRSEDQEEEVSQQTPLKKTRVSVRARCDTPTMNDGCQWRKYGQKVSKGNPCPRAYYRCTVSPNCPVRKQVQRCVEDMSILITTYEGTHNHTLPISATAMASTTSAAASMLQSSSSFSSASPPPSSSLYAGPINSSFPLRSSSNIPTSNNSHPTITLDLTTTPHNILSPHSNMNLSKYPSSSSSFSLSSSTSLSFSSFMPTNYSNTHQLSFGTALPNGLFNRNSLGSSSFNGSMNRQTSIMPSSIPQQSLSTDAIAAVITSNPSFRSALAAAFTSYVSGNAGQEHHGSGLSFKMGSSEGSLPFSASSKASGFSTSTTSDHKDRPK